MRGLSTILSLNVLTTVRGRHGRQKIIPPKNGQKLKKFIKHFVEINKNEVNKTRRQKTKESALSLVKVNASY